MNTPQALPMYLFMFALFIATCVASVHNVHPTSNNLEDKKLEILDGVYLDLPRANNTGRLLSFEVNPKDSLSEGRSASKKIMKRILPILVMPFIMQSALTPFVLGLLKFLLIKALLVGKLALTLIILNAFKNSNAVKGRDAELANAYYGYHSNGWEHYTTHFNR